jgi:hypothetical protein
MIYQFATADEELKRHKTFLFVYLFIFLTDRRKNESPLGVEE